MVQPIQSLVSSRFGMMVSHTYERSRSAEVNPPLGLLRAWNNHQADDVFMPEPEVGSNPVDMVQLAFTRPKPSELAKSKVMAPLAPNASPKLPEILHPWEAPEMSFFEAQGVTQHLNSRPGLSHSFSDLLGGKPVMVTVKPEGQNKHDYEVATWTAKGKPLPFMFINTDQPKTESPGLFKAHVTVRPNPSSGQYGIQFNPGVSVTYLPLLQDLNAHFNQTLPPLAKPNRLWAWVKKRWPF